MSATLHSWFQALANQHTSLKASQLTIDCLKLRIFHWCNDTSRLGSTWFAQRNTGGERKSLRSLGSFVTLIFTFSSFSQVDNLSSLPLFTFQVLIHFYFSLWHLKQAGFTKDGITSDPNTPCIWATRGWTPPAEPGLLPRPLSSATAWISNINLWQYPWIRSCLCSPSIPYIH